MQIFGILSKNRPLMGGRPLRRKSWSFRPRRLLMCPILSLGTIKNVKESAKSFWLWHSLWRTILANATGKTSFILMHWHGSGEMLHQKRFWVLEIFHIQQYFDSNWYHTPWASPWINSYWITFVKFYWTMQLKGSLQGKFMTVFYPTILVDRCWNRTNQTNTRVHALSIMSIRSMHPCDTPAFLATPQNCLSRNNPNKVCIWEFSK